MTTSKDKIQQFMESPLVAWVSELPAVWRREGGGEGGREGSRGYE